MASGTSSSSKRACRYKYAVEQEDIDRTPMVGGVGTLTEELPLEPENQALQQLLPGIPDHITLNHVTTQLPWTDTHTLPLLSRAWNQAIQSRQVHRRRVESQSTETVVFVSGKEGIALYSMRSKEFYSLPWIPGADPRFISGFSYVSLDDRVYILGGLATKPIDPLSFDSGSVYVLELGGQRTWRKCANMPQPRQKFECCILEGKIYVVGGFDDQEEQVYGSLVYDPTMDAWSPIMPRPHLHWVERIGVFPRELFLHIRMHSHDVVMLYPPLEDHDWYSDEDEWRIELMVFQVYNPVRNDWRKVSLPWRLDDPQEQHVFASSNGGLFVMVKSAIHRFNFTRRDWMKIHSFSLFPALGLINRRTPDSVQLHWVDLHSVLEVNGELLVIVICWRSYYSPITGLECQKREMIGTCLLQSEGFCSENKAIVWEKVNGSLDLGDVPCMTLVQL